MGTFRFPMEGRSFPLWPSPLLSNPTLIVSGFPVCAVNVPTSSSTRKVTNGAQARFPCCGHRAAPKCRTQRSGCGGHRRKGSIRALLG